MYFSRLAISTLAASISVVAQTPRHSEYVLFCPTPNHRNPFVHTVVRDESNNLLQTGIDVNRVTPPREFRRHVPLLIEKTESHSANPDALWDTPVGCWLMHLTPQHLNDVPDGDSLSQWMNAMRNEGVKRALVWIAIAFNREGKPKRMAIHRTEYFTTYDDDSKVSDAKRLAAIRASGLEQKINSVALEKAAHGFWTDVPHPKPRPFVGGAKVEFFDDEKLPIPEAPLYCAGKSCLPNP